MEPVKPRSVYQIGEFYQRLARASGGCEFGREGRMTEEEAQRRIRELAHGLWQSGKAEPASADPANQRGPAVSRNDAI